MHCREARNRLNNKYGLSDEEFLNHLRSCPACARDADAAGLLDKAFILANKGGNDKPTSFESVKLAVMKRYENNIKERSVMDQIKDQINQRPKLAAGFILALIAFLFITLVPFSYTRIAGYEVIQSGVADASNLENGNFEKAMAAIGYGDAQVEFNGKDIIVSNLPTRASAREVAVLMDSIIGSAREQIINTITQRISGSILAQVLEKQRTIEIDIKGKTTEEIREQIRQKLIAEGFMNPEIDVRADSDGVIDVYVKVARDTLDNKMEKALELKITADTDSFDLPLMESSIEERFDIDTEGKTNEEIKAEIEQKLAAEGKEGAVVKVTTRPDGKKEITVDLEKKVENK